jgi:hypothetical protein
MMNLMVDRVDVWHATVDDKPGGLAKMLSGLHAAGADLNFILARRAPDKPGTGVVFVTPLQGDKEIRAAFSLGFSVTRSLRSVRVEGENKPGIAAELAEKLAEAGINLRGFSGAVIGKKFILYIGFDADQDIEKAVAVLQQP